MIKLVNMLNLVKMIKLVNMLNLVMLNFVERWKATIIFSIMISHQPFQKYFLGTHNCYDLHKWDNRIWQLAQHLSVGDGIDIVKRPPLFLWSSQARDGVLYYGPRIVCWVMVQGIYSYASSNGLPWFAIKTCHLPDQCCPLRRPRSATHESILKFKFFKVYIKKTKPLTHRLTFIFYVLSIELFIN